MARLPGLGPGQCVNRFCFQAHRVQFLGFEVVHGHLWHARPGSVPASVLTALFPSPPKLLNQCPPPFCCLVVRTSRDLPLKTTPISDPPGFPKIEGWEGRWAGPCSLCLNLAKPLQTHNKLDYWHLNIFPKYDAFQAWYGVCVPENGVPPRFRSGCSRWRALVPPRFSSWQNRSCVMTPPGF